MNATNTVSLKPGQRVINRECGTLGTVSKLCTAKRNGSAYSYVVMTEYGVEVWHVCEFVVME